jgi:cold shock CspA family protein
MFGTVSVYNRPKGFGFILADDNSLPDFFCCAKFINVANKHLKYLVPGQRVAFDPVDIETKPAAHNVRIIGPQIVAKQIGGAQ